MARTLSALLALSAVAVFASVGTADNSTKNQMVKGTIKSVNLDDSVLIVNQQVKNETVERQLDILSKTEFEVTIGGETKTAVGKDGLALLVGKAGAKVKVKCDKDVNVLKVTAVVEK
jgi:hypothetical protein